MERITEYSIDWINNPEIFQVNRIPAHSDHSFYTEKVSEYGTEMELCQLLNGKWKYSFAPTVDDRIEDFYKEDYDVADFAEISVPGCIELSGYDTCQYINTMYPWEGHEDLRPPFVPKKNPVSSYVRFFDLDEKLKGKRIFISFQGVENAFYVWINGRFVGYSTDSFTPSEFDVTDFVKEKDNRLAVCVLKRSASSWLEDQDFFRFSGIFRDVYLYAIPKTHVRDIFVHANLDDTYTTGLLKCELKLEGNIAGSLGYELLDKTGKTIITRMGLMLKEELCFEATVKDVLKWSAEVPDLYLLNISIYDENGEPVEFVPVRVGFRRFEMKNGVMCINGKRIIFKGVNRHEFSHKTGRSLHKFEFERDIKIIKEHNINAVRTSHYPNSTYWYELADQFGLYIIDETNLETHGTWCIDTGAEEKYIVPGNDSIWTENVLDRAKSMLERDKNHPCVLIWSCGNESHAEQNIRNMSQFFHDRDPERLVHYESCVHNRAFEDITDMESHMYSKPDEIAKYLESDPKKPYISCEYTHAMGNSCGGMFKYTDLEYKYEKYQGGFIWDFCDQALAVKNDDGETEFMVGGDFGERPNDHYFCGNGIVFADRKLTPKAQEVKYLYQNIKLYPTNQGVLIVNENLFETTYDYIFEVRLLKDGKAVWAGSFSTDIEPGKEEFIPVTYPAMDEPGEYITEARAMLMGYRPWTMPGHLAAWGQSAPIMVKNEATGEASEELCFEDVVMGTTCVGVKTKGVHAIFSRFEGGMISYKVKGLELIETTPRITMFRAGTDNDKGNSYVAASAVYMGATKYQRVNSFAITYIMKDGREIDGTKTAAEFVLSKSDPEYGKGTKGAKIAKDIAKVVFKYEFASFVPEKLVNTVIYTMTPDGKVAVHAEYPGLCTADGKAVLPELPAFGMSFAMRSTFDRIEFYGRGPEENYNDRCKGAKLGIYKGKVIDNFTPYLDPQECGNRHDVRYYKIVDEFGHGAKISYVDRPLDVAVLPYSQFEIDEAYKKEWLPKSRRTFVEVRGALRGVGGDDTWGAPVHPEFCVDSKEKQYVDFVFEGL